ncbi:DUF5701 family protein [Cellulomonas oligotrophica]|uniref:Uncharacterized protein n=1 Tax=Cellulomonas oligotrophica TaxID=931536 RepID=A0A7Y9FFL0_9CELL|nr:DUF5701 family protein [Cellulomonas oligotrophica]NYD86295.1 hypothetical protein [Cellulomonas oligotrophica]GIG32814.1 hypothetical protein Col01nite_19730 [Cellulomonas oligotrophica]
MGVPVVAVDPALPTVLADRSPAAAAVDLAAPHADELDRQVRALVESGVAATLGWDADALGARADALRHHLDALPQPGSTTWAGAPDDAVPFVLVLPAVDVNAAAPAMRRGGRLGVSVIPPDEAAGYRPAHGVEVPPEPYLLVGVDTGSTWCGTAPEQATAAVLAAGRTPLTMLEGVLLTVVRPDVLRPNRCYSLAGSRTGTDQRVPAVWISESRAKLGWCWDRNPHTWLGLASATTRLSP